MFKWHLVIYGVMGLVSAITTWFTMRPRAAGCGKCGYPIHDDAVSRCPECGTSLRYKSLRQTAFAPTPHTVIIAVLFAWIMIGVGVRPVADWGMRALDATKNPDRDALLWIEDVGSDLVDRVILASPPGLNEANLATSTYVANMNAATPTELRIERTDGTVAIYPTPWIMYGPTIEEWFASIGIAEDLDRLAAARQDPAMSAKGLADRYGALDQFVGWWQLDIWDDRTHRRRFRENQPAEVDGRQPVTIRGVYGDPLQRPAPERAGWAALIVTAILGLAVQAPLMMRRNRRIEIELAAADPDGTRTKGADESSAETAGGAPNL